jgi:hypothetical protein
MIYGYSRAVLNEHGLLEMKEITFALDPKRLIQIGEFLIEMAREMEAGAFETCSHRHLTTSLPEWNRSVPVADIIVARPSVTAAIPPPSDRGQ